MMELRMPIFREINIVKFLTKKYGGKWKYNKRAGGTWECDDGIRIVRSVRMCDHDDECGCPTTCFLYSSLPNVIPEHVSFV